MYVWELHIWESCERPNDASSSSDSDSDIDCTSNGERREDTTIAESQPCQPTLTQYDRKKCGAKKLLGTSIQNGTRRIHG